MERGDRLDRPALRVHGPGPAARPRVLMRAGRSPSRKRPLARTVRGAAPIVEEPALRAADCVSCRRLLFALAAVGDPPAVAWLRRRSTPGLLVSHPAGIAGWLASRAIAGLLGGDNGIAAEIDRDRHQAPSSS